MTYSAALDSYKCWELAIRIKRRDLLRSRYPKIRVYRASSKLWAHLRANGVTTRFVRKGSGE